MGSRVTALHDLLAWFRAWRFWRRVRADWRWNDLQHADDLRDMVNEARNNDEGD